MKYNWLRHLCVFYLPKKTRVHKALLMGVDIWCYYITVYPWTDFWFSLHFGNFLTARRNIQYVGLITVVSISPLPNIHWWWKFKKLQLPKISSPTVFIVFTVHYPVDWGLLVESFPSTYRKSISFVIYITSFSVENTY